MGSLLSGLPEQSASAVPTAKRAGCPGLPRPHDRKSWPRSQCSLTWRECATPDHGTVDAVYRPRAVQRRSSMTNVSDNREWMIGEATGLTPLPVMRIAIADDDPDSLELLHLALESPMTEIYEATNGVELVRLLVENDPFELVITDVLMQWIEGLQVFRFSRVAEFMTPFLVSSGLPRADLQAMVDRLGSARLLRKPFGIQELRAAVIDLLHGQLLS